tara:strand:- start:3240 stop:4340 length:1101 start_codon:yes stop_codon:yes gene_type:complete
MVSENDNKLMLRCTELALKGEYSCKPNPRVGSIIVKDQQIIAEGWHQYAGELHAEVDALEKAGSNAEGASLYVTLEPCSHHGRTSPCCDAIIAAGISKVFYGMIDPNPKVAGKGISKLKQAGIEVIGPLMPRQCEDLNPGFIRRMTSGRPYVRCKMAMSLDGRTAMASGESQWITGEDSRTDVHRWRAKSSAIITGVESVLKDDPSLNARLEHDALIQPLRVICDSQLRTPDSAKTMQIPGHVLLVSASDRKFGMDKQQTAEVEQVNLPGKNTRTDLAALLTLLAQEKECNEVLIEAGPTLAGAFIEQGLVDELLIYTAPILLGHQAQPLFKLHGMEKIADQIKLEFIDVVSLGKDCRIRSRIDNK